MSGYARQRKGPKLMNCCNPEQVNIKEHGKMLKRTQVLEEGRIPTSEARNWNLKKEKKDYKARK